MRIAQLANFVGPASGGMKTALHALGSGYVAAGMSRLLVIPGPQDRRVSTAHGDVVELRSPRVRGGYRLMVEPWRVMAALESFGPTTVEVSDKSTLLPVTGWARRRGVGCVLFSHERLDAMLSLRTGWETLAGGSVAVLNRLLLRQFDAVVVTSAFARGEFSGLAEAAGTPVHQVRLGVDLQAFRPDPPVGADIHPGSSPPLRLVHAGRLSREKSPHLAVRTALELHARGVPVRLDVHGDGPHRGELEALAAGGPVVFHGHQPDPRRLSRALARADVALSVCPGETFGLAVLEALASGTPVVTADVGGARELVDTASGAWAAADPGALADAVLGVASRPRAENRTAARRRAERFAWSRTVDAMLAVHDDHRRTPSGHATSHWMPASGRAPLLPWMP